MSGVVINDTIEFFRNCTKLAMLGIVADVDESESNLAKKLPPLEIEPMTACVLL